MRYRFILIVPLLVLLASCQPVNRNKTTPSVAVETPQQPATDSQPAGGNTLQQTVPGK